MNRFPVENIDKVEESVNADKLSSSKKITLSGDISGFTNFDGSSDVSISVNVATADFATDAEHAASSDTSSLADKATLADTATLANRATLADTASVADIATLLNWDNVTTEPIELVVAYSPRWYRRMNLPVPNKTTITIPARTQVNINNKGYISLSDVTLSLNNFVTAANRKGKDLYIYACAPTSGIEPVFVISLNSTVPDGYTATNSRKIGGFHCLCADVGTISGHTLSGYVAGDILPLSVWDLLHRPVSDPEGMVYVLGRWYDIYLASYNGSKLVSVYGGTTADGTSSPPFHGERFVEYFGKVNKRPISRDEFCVIAKGSNENTNIYGSSDPNTTGGHKDTNNRRMISNYGLEDCCGALWQFTSDIHGMPSADNSSTKSYMYGIMNQTVDAEFWIHGYNWNNKSVHASAIDGSTQLYGSCYGAMVRCLVGGHWDNGSNCSSRCSDWSALSSVFWDCSGSRGSSEPIFAI